MNTKNRCCSIILLLAVYSFCVISTSAHAVPPAQVPVTGQTMCYDTAGTAIGCAGTGQDGEFQAGVTWPNPRFTDNGNGTVTDNLTGLVWLQNANCSATLGGIVKSGNGLYWPSALTWSNNLKSGDCGLADGSTAGQWRLPNINELESLVDDQRSSPALPSGHPFSNVQNSHYWSSSTSPPNSTQAWSVYMDFGAVVSGSKVGINNYVWPVRSGQ